MVNIFNSLISLYLEIYVNLINFLNVDYIIYFIFYKFLSTNTLIIITVSVELN